MTATILSRSDVDLNPAKGLKVRVKAAREAIFGEEGVEVKKITVLDGETGKGVLTGRTLAGYSEVDMPALDGRKHWYPIDQLVGENGEKVIEEEILIEIEEDYSEEDEE